MTLKTEKIKYATGKEIEVMRESLQIGRKILKTEGYIQCPNPEFMQKGNSIVYYNKTKKYWVFEVKKCTDD